MRCVICDYCPDTKTGQLEEYKKSNRMLDDNICLDCWKTIDNYETVTILDELEQLFENIEEEQEETIEQLNKEKAAMSKPGVSK